MRNLVLFLVLLMGVCFFVIGDTQNSPACASDNGSQLIAAGGAKLEMGELIIRKKGETMNLRAAVKNVGTVAATNLTKNLTIYLYVKDDAGAWKLVKEWANIAVIKPGEKASRDLTPVSTFAEFTKDEFTVKAEIKLKTPIKGVTITQASLEKSYPADAIVNP